MNDLQDHIPLKRKRRESFKDRVAILVDEFGLSIEFQRSTVLIAVYGSELIREKAEKALRGDLSKLGQNVSEIKISKALFDLPALFEQYPTKENSIFFISGLQWGGGVDGQNAYRSLNLRRDYFVDNQLRVLFWLTESEAVNLPRLAPDFWSFRHRVVEFLEAPIRKRKRVYPGDLTWPDWKSNNFTDDLDGEVELRKRLLANLPAASESNSIRAELYYALAALSWAKGENLVSLAYLNRGKVNAQYSKDPRLIARFWAGFGFVSHTMNRLDDAVKAYKKALEQQPKDPVSWISLSLAYRDKNWMVEAIDASRKAIKLEPTNADYWNRLGNLYWDQRRMDDAIHAYEQSIKLDAQSSSLWCILGSAYLRLDRIPEAITAYEEAARISPQNEIAYISLATCFRKSENPAELEKNLDCARKLLAPGNVYSHACIESVEGNVDEALAMIKMALRKKQVNQFHLRNDPNLDFLRDDARFQALAGS